MEGRREGREGSGVTGSGSKIGGSIHHTIVHPAHKRLE